MKHIAFLGLGAMGSRMAARLVDAGFAVTAWNRTPDRAPALVDAGLELAETPAAAARGADVVIAMVRDDAASRAIWLADGCGALATLSAQAIAIECSTLSVPFTGELHQRFAQAGRVLVDAPVAGSRPQAEAGKLIFLAGGSAAAVTRIKPVLEPMAGAIHHAGDAGAGATVKLMVNALFGAQLAMLAELLGFARKAGIDAQTAVALIGATPVCSPAAGLAASAMLARSWAPAFPIDLVAKDFELLRASAAANGCDA